MRLYYSPGACSQAVHIVLLETNRRFELERVDLATHRTAGGHELSTINPKGTVPVLELGSERLTETQVILQYVADLEPAMRLAPPAGTFARYRLQEWLAFLSEVDAQFSQLFDPDIPEAYAARVRGRIADRFGFVQNQIAAHAYLMGETFTVADAYLFVMLRWSHGFGFDLPLWPNLADYEDRLLLRPAVLQALDAEGVSAQHGLRRSA